MGRRPTKGARGGGERDEDHENSFVSFIFSRSYGFEHSVSSGDRKRDLQRCFDRGELLPHKVPGDRGEDFELEMSGS